MIGGTGGIGAALLAALPAAERVSLARRTSPGFELTDEPSIAEAASSLRHLAPFARIIDATGTLAIDGHAPEKRLADLDPVTMARAFAINAIGPALLLKHFVGLLPRQGRSVFATLSARVGSIADNHLGGWYSYRASKAALNQFWRTAAVEIARQRPGAVLLALHPGTVRTGLSETFTRPGQGISPPDAAERLLATMDAATRTGLFLDNAGQEIPW